VLAFINIAGLGMMLDMAEQEDFNPEAVAQLARKHKDVVVGVKSAHYQKPDWESVDAAVRAGKMAGIPVMVDFGYFLPQRPFWQLVTERLRPGDMATHMFRGPVPWTDAQGKLYPYVQRARERGVLFDVGHGGGSFALRNAVPATRQGFYPDTISTDLHNGSMNAPMQDMNVTMSKFLTMGMPIEEAILRSTWKPAQAMGQTELGRLDGIADIAVLRVEKGEFAFADGAGGKIPGGQRVICELTVKNGAVVWDRNARAAVDYRTLPPDYGVRPNVDRVIAPPK